MFQLDQAATNFNPTHALPTTPAVLKSQETAWNVDKTTKNIKRYPSVDWFDKPDKDMIRLLIRRIHRL